MAFERNLLLIGAGLGLVLVIGAAWAARRVVPAVASAVNPLNRENIFAQGSNVAAQVVTGDAYDTWGTAWWKWLNPDLVAREREITAPSLFRDRPGAGASGSW